MASETNTPAPAAENAELRPREPTSPALEMRPGNSDHDYTDGRAPWDWESKYPKEARGKINFEAAILGFILVAALLATGICLGRAGSTSNMDFGAGTVSVSWRLLAIFFTGLLGGVTFSIKWLIHSVAKGKWHLDRRYWRFLVPVIGGVYACVVLTLFGAGWFGTQPGSEAGPMANTAALAFLVGYFSDGVSGLLSNVANAVFGTLEKK